jgi:hypothetical protein
MQQQKGTFFPSTVQYQTATDPEPYAIQFEIEKSQFKKAPEFT